VLEGRGRGETSQPQGIKECDVEFSGVRKEGREVGVGVGDTVRVNLMRSATPNIWALCVATAKPVGNVTRVMTGAIDGACLI